ncbi:4-hydroxythreonine-4-phosphate dehydrogenase PdxA [Pistricoccus aurantiacus]|uniref:4-hydroxythreonine-4-phosphate dehydrogenase n=1 Tax=Pistricoccus aurantiacus TaxID=1883414 RepID=A0A5B8SWF6_9GAMM|nr:4-hydroxythreonine-4-phosphate dehydrogenase PdxA [Pistricoccus aurantiacus]QEA39090.1 4-hydroxythreonine-4-phosphate dehydrogenase PdxA [Pistricoccus aurantiacus]
MVDSRQQPCLALTTGEPAGIGPELVLKLTQDIDALPGRIVAVGDPQLLTQRARALDIPIELDVLAMNESPRAARPGVLSVWPVPLRVSSRPGVLDPANADYVLNTLDVAIAACDQGSAQAMVTSPLHKGAIIEGGHPGFTGHTEYLRDACGVDEVVMMLATQSALHGRVAGQPYCPLRVALATTHLPLRQVAQAITQPGLERVLRILARDLKRHFGIACPRIAVCGLNPHAGEGGHLGDEEITTLIPVLERLRGEGMQLIGPLPADTLFTPRHLDQVDAVLAMYHDQGLAVLKYAGFGLGANITLGLPLIRTSVDHGTALDLAGKGVADPGSLRVALQVAADMARAANQGLP